MLFLVFGRPGPSQSASPEGPTLPVATDDEAATIVAYWGKIHVGYVLVYGDGRVILMPDLRAVFPFPEAEGYPYFEGLFERRLTADGLDLVRSGAVPASAFLPDERVVTWTESKTSLPAGLWADPEFKVYLPSKYAVCEDPRAVERLPTSVQGLLRGKERTYNPRGSNPVECFEVSSEEARVLREIGVARLDPVAILPHGEWVEWGG